MVLTIVEDDPHHLAEYARVPIAFMVEAVFDADAVEALRRGAPAAPTPLATPYRKDYDAYPGNHPTEWAASFDVRRWLVLSAFRDGRRVGGAILIFEDPAVSLLTDCSDCALIWDIRVAADSRRQHVGAALLLAAEDATRRRIRGTLCVETQQVNVPACRFYQRHGFAIARVRAGAYPDMPDETQLIWCKRL